MHIAGATVAKYRGTVFYECCIKTIDALGCVQKQGF